MKAVFLSLTALVAAFGAGAPITPAFAENTAESQTVIAVNRLAATLAAARTQEEVSQLIFNARATGLSDTQIAFAFGLASRITPSPAIVEAAFMAFQAETGLEAKEITLAFTSGAQSVSAPGSGAAGSGGAFGSAPLGASGLAGGGSGGGGASPR